MNMFRVSRNFHDNFQTTFRSRYKLKCKLVQNIAYIELRGYIYSAAEVKQLWLLDLDHKESTLGEEKQSNNGITWIGILMKWCG